MFSDNTMDNNINNNIFLPSNKKNNNMVNNIDNIMNTDDFFDIAFRIDKNIYLSMNYYFYIIIFLYVFN